MDSGNSGSLQSSSGGDEELDSHADTFSALMSHPQQEHVSFMSKYPVSHPQPQHHQHQQIFDPLSTYLNQIRTSSSSLSNQNSLPNMDMLWSRPLRSNPNHDDLPATMPSSSSPQNTVFLQSQMPSVQTRRTGVAAFPLGQHALLPPDTSASFSSGGLVSVSPSTDQAPTNNNVHNTLTPNSSSTANPNNTAMVRNPKKRSRASRRAPTTVLTTDTANFRAMVQEFTGIPAPPFTSTQFPRNRLDLLGTAAASNLRSAHFDPLPFPPYLSRQFAHNVQPLSHPFVSPSSSSNPSFPFSSPMVVDSLISDSTSLTAHSASVNYRLSSDLGLLKQTPENLLNMNMHTHTMFNSQSIDPTPSIYPLANSRSINIGSRPQGSLEMAPISATADPNIKMGCVFAEFGSHGHGHVNQNLSGLENMVNSSSDGALSGSDGINKGSINWGNARSTTNDESSQNVLTSNPSGNLRTSERPINDDNGNYSVSSSDFHGDKGPDCVATTRTEGMVKSWISCSSD